MATSKHLIYTRTTPPATYTPGWLANEFGTIQRALHQVASGAAAIKIAAGATPDPYYADAVDAIIVCDCTAAAIHIYLPVASNASGVTITAKKIDSTGNSVVVAVSGGGTIDGVLSEGVPTQYNSVTCRSDGVQWWLIAKT